MKERIKNYNFAVKEWQGDIIFLRNLVEGAASHRYGIHVARLAGLPAEVIERAKEILAGLEGDASERATLSDTAAPSEMSGQIQMGLFSSAERKIRDELRRLDVTRMTPLEALNLIARLSDEAREQE